MIDFTSAVSLGGSSWALFMKIWHTKIPVLLKQAFLHSRGPSICFLHTQGSEDTKHEYFESHIMQQWIFQGKSPAGWVAFRWKALCFPRSLILGFIFLQLQLDSWVYTLKALWYHLLRETLSQLVPCDFMWNGWSLPKVSAGVGVCFTSQLPIGVFCNMGTD